MLNKHSKHPLILAGLAGLLFLLASCEPATPIFPRGELGATPSSGATADSQQPAQQTLPAVVVTPAATASPALPTATPTPASTIAVNPADLRGLQLVFWHTWSGSALGEMHRLVDEFNASNEWGIVIRPEYQGNLDELNAKATAALQAGEPPDILTGYLHQALAWEELQPLVDIDQYVRDPLWGLTTAEQADFFPAMWEQDIFQGKRIGVPALRTAQVLYYNQGWGRDLGFDAPPQTLQEFAAQACAANQARRLDEDVLNDGTGGWIISTRHASLLSWMYAYGAEILLPAEAQNAENTYSFDTPEVQASFEFLRGLYDQGCAWLADAEPPEVEFASRQGLFAGGSPTDLTFQASAMQRQGNQDAWTVIPFPSPDGKPVMTVYGPSYVLTQSTPGKALAGWLFLEWLLQPEHQARLVQATGSLPLRASTMDYLSEYASQNPQWAAVVDLLSFARPEPSLASWDLVRWAVSDAGTQLFRSYFSSDRIPDLIRLLDQTADDLHQSPLKDRFLQGGITSELTPTPTMQPATATP